MFGGLLIKILGGLLVASLLFGGFYYVKNLRNENAKLMASLAAEKKVTEFFREAAKIDQDTLKAKEKEVHEIIKSSGPDKSQRIHDMYYRLRRFSPTTEPDKSQ